MVTKQQATVPPATIMTHRPVPKVTGSAAVEPQDLFGGEKENEREREREEENDYEPNTPALFDDDDETHAAASTSKATASLSVLDPTVAANVPHPVRQWILVKFLSVRQTVGHPRPPVSVTLHGSSLLTRVPPVAVALRGSSSSTKNRENRKDLLFSLRRTVGSPTHESSVVRPEDKDPLSSSRRTDNDSHATKVTSPTWVTAAITKQSHHHARAESATFKSFSKNTTPLFIENKIDPATAPYSTSTVPNQTNVPNPAKRRHLRGSSSSANDHDHDHQRLLAVARIGQKPTMDKPNKYFNLFWCSLLISILGLSSFVVQRISKTIKMPNHLEDNYGIVRTDGESQLRAALNTNRCTARNRRKGGRQFNRDDLKTDRYVRMTNK